MHGKTLDTYKKNVEVRSMHTKVLSQHSDSRRFFEGGTRKSAQPSVL